MHNRITSSPQKLNSEQEDETRVNLDPNSTNAAVGSSSSFVITGQPPSDITFFADGNYWLLSKGIVGINNVILIQKT